MPCRDGGVEREKVLAGEVVRRAFPSKRQTVLANSDSLSTDVTG